MDREMMRALEAEARSFTTLRTKTTGRGSHPEWVSPTFASYSATFSTATNGKMCPTQGRPRAMIDLSYRSRLAHG